MQMLPPYIYSILFYDGLFSLLGPNWQFIASKQSVVCYQRWGAPVITRQVQAPIENSLAMTSQTDDSQEVFVDHYQPGDLVHFFSP